MCAAVVSLYVPSVSAELSLEQTWHAEHTELLGQLNRLKASKRTWRNPLAAETLDRQALANIKVTSGPWKSISPTIPESLNRCHTEAHRLMKFSRRTSITCVPGMSVARNASSPRPLFRCTVPMCMGLNVLT